MPTRIVLDVSNKRPPPVTPGASFRETKSKPKFGREGKLISSKRVVGFPSKIFRSSREEIPQQPGISTSDIRASPRLIGYIYQLLASVVLLISVVAFYKDDEQKLLDIDLQELKENLRREIYNSLSGPVYYWKLIGSAVIGSVGVAMSLIITVAHFDTVCFPKFWLAIFRDGSKWEQNLMRFMILFWAAGLHVCTSSLSVGEVQGNVFFTTWIAFAASAMNYGVWRTSSGLESFAEKVSTHHRETTYNWLWLLLCICIFAGAATDIYFNRDELDLRFDGSDLSDRDWRMVLAMVWSFLGLGIISVALNHYWTQSLDIRCGGSCHLGWRHFEGIIIMFMVLVFFYLLIEHSGANGVVNGLNNSYFSMWGAFFNSVFLLGTWLRENNNILGDESPG
jgi:hypothetical protein